MRYYKNYKELVRKLYDLKLWFESPAKLKVVHAKFFKTEAELIQQDEFQSINSNSLQR